MDKEPITLNGLNRLEEELVFLKEKKRPEIVAAISEARSHGDLKENAEYHAAKEEQSHNEGRVAEINDFKMTSYGPWQISKDGGKSLVILENTGNSPTTINLEILSIPEGWRASGNNIIVISPGQRAGIPLEIIPSENWTGEIKTMRILAQDPEGNQKEILIEKLVRVLVPQGHKLIKLEIVS